MAPGARVLPWFDDQRDGDADPGQHPDPGRAAPARAVVQAAPAVLVGDGEPLVDVLEDLAAAEAVGQPVTT
jgi:hypothetical protein